MEPVLNETFLHLPNTTDYKVTILVDGVIIGAIVFKDGVGSFVNTDIQIAN